MHPILYTMNETNFNHLGLGVLADATSCMVTEERNGVFELNMEYPTSDAFFNVIDNDQLIKADAGHKLKGQLFRIKRIDINMAGIMKIHAVHVSYMTSDLAVRPDINIVNATAQTALNMWRASIIDENPLRVNSDLTHFESLHLTLSNTENARGGLSKILDTWGGEFLFDNYDISLLASRGTTANTILAYGRNLIDLTQEENISTTYTSIYPFAIYRGTDGEEETITIPSFIVDSEYVETYPNRRVLKVDFSRDFEHGTRPTSNELQALAQAYIQNNKIGVPRVSISVDFVDITKALGGNETNEEINLCDIVPIYFEKLGIMARAQIVRVEWDVLLEQYATLEIGDIKESFSNRIRNQTQKVEAMRQELQAQLSNNRDAIRGELAGVRGELVSQIDGKHDVLMGNINNVRVDIGDVRHELTLTREELQDLSTSVGGDLGVQLAQIASIAIRADDATGVLATNLLTVTNSLLALINDKENLEATLLDLKQRIEKLEEAKETNQS